MKDIKKFFINKNIFENFFPKKWRKKVNQDTLVGLALIFVTMFTMFAWIIYYYLKIIVLLLKLISQVQILLI